jgi:hypothetical protein
VYEFRRECKIDLILEREIMRVRVEIEFRDLVFDNCGDFDGNVAGWR